MFEIPTMLQIFLILGRKIKIGGASRLQSRTRNFACIYSQLLCCVCLKDKFEIEDWEPSFAWKIYFLCESQPTQFIIFKL